MKKRALALVAVVAVAGLMAVGCGSKKAETEAPAETQAVTTEAATTEAAEETEAATTEAATTEAAEETEATETEAK